MRFKKKKFPERVGEYREKLSLRVRECRVCEDRIWLEPVRMYWSDILNEYFRPLCSECWDKVPRGWYD